MQRSQPYFVHLLHCQLNAHASPAVVFSCLLRPEHLWPAMHDGGKAVNLDLLPQLAGFFTYRLLPHTLGLHGKAYVT